MMFKNNKDGKCVLYAVANLTNDPAVLAEPTTPRGLLSYDLSRILDKYLGPRVGRSVAVEPVLITPARASAGEFLASIGPLVGPSSSAASVVLFFNILAPGGVRHCVLCFYSLERDELTILDSTKQDKEQTTPAQYFYNNYVIGAFVVIDTKTHQIIFINE
jgi:hypothetical protein